ncbi:hypothetical protein B6D52_00420 [Candidatus Parcubacteria bacterium 4484_255]|nr:MAG: hypothetical protein B6D52_00420 [Candidatus Parcubacteria bacterium 4484_255]
MPRRKAKQTEDPIYGRLLLGWTFPEYARHKRSFKWYLLVSLILVSVALYSFITGNFLFVI